MKKTILFDLDGTLIDTSEGILNSIEKTIKDLLLQEKNRDELISFIGPPLQGAFEEIYGLDKYRAEEAVSVFRKHYKSEDMLICKPYDGIEELLTTLKRQGMKLFVATSKPTEFAIQILKNFGLYDYFEQVVGSNIDNTRTSKAEVIQFILDYHSVSDTVIMVGDKAQDLIGAAKTHVSAIGVTYGFGTREELLEESSVAIVDSVDDLLKILQE